MILKLAGLLSGVAVLLIWFGLRFVIALMKRNRALAAETTASLTDSAPGMMHGVLGKFLSYWQFWLVPLLAIIAVSVVLALSGQVALDPLAVAKFDRQQHIQETLNPDKLVPPPELPPSLFIIQDHPELATADRNWRQLDPEFMQTALLVFARMKERGLPVVLLEGYRSPERQNQLADSGMHVTNARAFQSKHQFGMAIDAAPIKDGKLIISAGDPWAMQVYQALGEESEKAGLIWGGRWKLQDYGHIESSKPIPHHE